MNLLSVTSHVAPDYYGSAGSIMHRLGYRKMPKRMYQNCLLRMQSEERGNWDGLDLIHTAPANTKNPFAEYGFDNSIMMRSASETVFEEFFDLEDTVELGSVYFNIRTYEIVGFIAEEKLEKEIDVDVIALSVDPKADVYWWITPYAYCGNNPIRITDPNGMEWEIDGIKYNPGQACPVGVAQHTQDKWNTMNKIYSTENGKKTIDEMNVEGVMYKVSSEVQVTDANGSYQTNGDRTGGTIYLNGNNKSMRTLSHEIFHGYQDLKGQGGASVHNEVEAMLFDNSVMSQYAYMNSSGLPRISLQGSDAAYNHQVNKMINGYSDDTMNHLVSGFKNYSRANMIGSYNAYPLRRTNQGTSLIKNFYPLMCNNRDLILQTVKKVLIYLTIIFLFKRPLGF